MNLSEPEVPAGRAQLSAAAHCLAFLGHFLFSRSVSGWDWSWKFGEGGGAGEGGGFLGMRGIFLLVSDVIAHNSDSYIA